MKHLLVSAATLFIALTFLPRTASAARPLDPTKTGSEDYCRSPVVKRWRKMGPARYLPSRCTDNGPTNMQLHRKMLRLKGNYFTSRFSWAVVGGQKDPQELQYYVDSLATTRLRGGRTWFPIFWVDSRRQSQVRAPLALYLYKHPNAAQLIAAAITTPKQVGVGYATAEPTPWWALWYLGAKQYAPTIIGSLLASSERGRPVTRHTQFILSVLDRWHLSPALKNKVEQFCINHVLKPGATHGGAALGCMRYLGRIQTKNPTARQLIAGHIKGRATLGSLEAIRALSHMGSKKLKKIARANLKSAERNFVKLVKRGRRVRQVSYKAHTAHHDAVPSAIALVGLGDGKALSIIKHWLMTYDISGHIQQENAFLAVFQETAFAPPRAIKKIKPLLRKALQKAISVSRKNKSMERVALYASLALLQLGDNSGLSRVLKAIKTIKRDSLYHLTVHLGTDPAKTYSAWGIGSGIGHLRVGPGGVSIKDAMKLVNALHSRFKTIPVKKPNDRAYVLQAIADIHAVIEVARKKL